jgi:2-keto-4-pentenoate hydratase/2-oxohepta-3-ene-1,7-dioic acid hydratase in catechol pathway
MRIVRFATARSIKYGVIDKDVIYGYKGKPFNLKSRNAANFSPDGTRYRINEVRLLAPCLPSKIVCLGLNYRSHAAEFNSPAPEKPIIFLKPPTAVIGPEADIMLPNNGRIDYECELAVVIGKKAKNVPAGKAVQYILGYTCFNDVTDRDAQKLDGQWTRAKGYDTFAPIGPHIDTDIDPGDLQIETLLNGERRQNARTGDLIFGVAELVSFISGVMTLLPGDVIATGTPSGIGSMKDGDTVEIKIEGIGVLRNYVIKAK